MSNEERISRLEQAQIDMKENLVKITGVVENIRDNHLHSIEGKIDNIEKNLAYYLGGLAALIFIGDLLLRIYK